MVDMPGNLDRPSPVPSALTERRAGYRAVRSVEVRARTTDWGQDARTRAALERLDGRLAAKDPPRRDVPPGYYLDISV